MLARLCCVLGLLLAPGIALAQAEPFSLQSLSGYVDLRASAADGETTWVDGGFGKVRAPSGARLSLGEADLAWRPTLAWDWSAVVEGEFQPDHERAPQLGEAYIRYKPFPIDEVHYSARFGLFYPPISEEHSGPFWTPTETITPSAINSWVGEEIKVAGLEASARRDFGDQSLGLTAAVFGDNDTSGTLLSLRGWTLDDVRTGAGSQFTLPPLSDFLEYVQSPTTNPINELDSRPGFYGRADWRINERLALNVFYYDNPGDLRDQNQYQWAWDTRFLNVGGRLDLDDRTRLLSQIMVGKTIMGPLRGDPWVDSDFTAGYLLITRQLGQDSVTGRVDAFSTRDLADPDYGSTQERGWALTADYRKRLTDHVSALVEILHVESDRPARVDLLAESGLQRQTELQGALRLSF